MRTLSERKRRNHGRMLARLAVGGMLFQTTGMTGCGDDLFRELGATVFANVTSAVVNGFVNDAINGALNSAGGSGGF